MCVCVFTGSSVKQSIDPNSGMKVYWLHWPVTSLPPWKSCASFALPWRLQAVEKIQRNRPTWAGVLIVFSVSGLPNESQWFIKTKVSAWLVELKQLIIQLWMTGSGNDWRSQHPTHQAQERSGSCKEACCFWAPLSCAWFFWIRNMTYMGVVLLNVFLKKLQSNHLRLSRRQVVDPGKHLRGQARSCSQSHCSVQIANCHGCFFLES